MISNQKKLALLELPETRGVLFDALITFLCDARGEEVEEVHLAEMVDALLFSLKKQYQPVAKKVSKQIDLEDSIEQVKKQQHGKDNQDNQ